MATSTRIWTDEELLALPDDGKYELVDGELLYMSPAGARHGRIISRLNVALGTFVNSRGSGDVFDGQTGYRWAAAGGNLRSPDLSFVAAGRLEQGIPTGFIHLAPDLAIEVLSPSERAGEIAQKVAEYLSVGVRLLWVIDPEKNSAVVYRPGLRPRTVRGTESLEGEDVLPGFAHPLADIFEGPVVGDR
jgi:Uma2 family endonuclease